MKKHIYRRHPGGMWMLNYLSFLLPTRWIKASTRKKQAEPAQTSAHSACFFIWPSAWKARVDNRRCPAGN